MSRSAPIFMALVASSVYVWEFTPRSTTEGVFCGFAIGLACLLVSRLFIEER